MAASVCGHKLTLTVPLLAQKVAPEGRGTAQLERRVQSRAGMILFHGLPVAGPQGAMCGHGANGEFLGPEVEGG